MTAMSLSVNGLRVTRGSRFTLRVDRLRCLPGSTVCLTGPNGSGKTTFLECLAGLITPDAGEIRMCNQPVGRDVRATKALIGFIPDDEEWFIKELSAWEYFRLLSGIYREAGVRTDMAKRLGELAAALRFTAFAQPLATLSHGNKKKAQLIAALMHEPKVIVVDELRNGLDPLSIIAAERLMREQTKRGACVVAATHDLWWAERVAREIVLLVNGRVVSIGRTKTIVREHGSVESLFRNVIEGVV